MITLEYSIMSNVHVAHCLDMCQYYFLREYSSMLEVQLPAVCASMDGGPLPPTRRNLMRILEKRDEMGYAVLNDIRNKNRLVAAPATVNNNRANVSFTDVLTKDVLINELGVPLPTLMFRCMLTYRVFLKARAEHGLMT